MGSTETLLLALATVTVVLLVVDLAREELRGHRDRRHLDRLGMLPPEPVDDEVAPPPAGQLTRRLRAAGLPVGALTFLAFCMLLGLFAALALQTWLPSVPLAALAAGTLAAFLPWVFLGSWAKRRANRFEAQLVDALGFMIGSLQAGENPLAAFASAAEASHGLVRRELYEVARRLRLGIGIRRALRPIAIGYDSEGVRLFAQTLIAKWEAGGDLVPILDSVARVVRERLRVRLRLRSHLAGARVSSVMIAVLPYAVIPLFLWQLPNLVDRLVTHPLGPSLIVIAVLLQIIGWLWLGRILRIEL